MADLPRPVLARSSPAIRAHVLRRIVLVFCGVLLAGALLVVVFNLDGPADQENSEEPAPGVIEEYVPPPFRGHSAASSSDDPEVIFESGAWIEVADVNGRLVQMYRAERLEPQAEGMIDLLEPVAVMFLSRGRVLTLEGNFCRAKRRSDNDIIESGRVSGDVRIRMFDPVADEQPRYATAPPSVYIETADAVFDNISGEITCPGEVLVRTGTFEFHGRDLTARYDEENGLQFLRAEQTLRPIRIAATAVDAEDAPGAAANPGLDEPAVEIVWPRNTWLLQDSSPPSESGSDDEPRRQDRPRRRRDAIEAIPEGMQLYRATFADNVHIWRGHEEETQAEQVILGDELRAVFTLEDSGLEEEPPRVTMARRISRDDPIWSGPAGAMELSSDWKQVITVWILAAAQDSPPLSRDDIMPPPREEDLRISHEGPLTIVPINEPDIALAHEDDVYLEVAGTPTTLVDRDAASTAECAMMTYSAAADEAILIGAEQFPLVFTSPELVANGERFEYGFTRDRGAFVGPGTMQILRRPDDESAADPAPREQTSPDPSLAIAWSEGVDLSMSAKGESDTAIEERSSRLEEAVFRGHVQVTEQRFAMTSDRLRVDFDTTSNARDEIELIEAGGSVDVQGLDARGGRLTADDLRIDFEVDTDTGSRRPALMTATGNAHLEDPTQSVDANLLIAHLVPAQATEGEEAVESAGRFGEVEVDVFHARESVRIVLDNGTQATGDEFIAKVRENVADLTGAPVVIDGGDDDSEFHAKGDSVHIERLDDGRSKLTMGETVIARIINHGPVRGFDALAAPGGDVAKAPVVAGEAPATPQVIDVACDERLEYLEGLAGESDILELFGTVRAKSTAALEDSSVEGEYLRLDFAEALAAEEAEPAENVPQGAEPEAKRALRRMIAKGDAKLESRSWLTAAREESGLRIVYVAGDHVEYDQQTMTADVPGAGELLIVDQRTQDSGAPAAENAEPGGNEDPGLKGLTGKGTTVFRWQRSMRMRQVEEGLFAMHMQGGVIMLHQSDLGRQDDASLTTEALDVEFGRRGPEDQVSAMDFGGAMELRRFDAVGAAHLVAMGKIIDGLRITYDAAGQLAEIFGAPAQPAEIMVTGARAPQRAEKFIWDLRQDKVTIIRAVGGAGQ